MFHIPEDLRVVPGPDTSRWPSHGEGVFLDCAKCIEPYPAGQHSVKMAGITVNEHAVDGTHVQDHQALERAYPGNDRFLRSALKPSRHSNWASSH